MPGRSFTVDLTDDDAQRLEARAADLGLSVPELLHSLIKTEIDQQPDPIGEDLKAARRRGDPDAGIPL